MQTSERQYTPEQSNKNNYDAISLEQQLAQAREEIADLKLQIIWLERSYE
ncbi:hypothetical protein [Thalassotalea piscium]|uniref:Uncharacterized protein n=1 Tax=Thalassotalea piscium TaxID=1230533 RepID=A0A7X0TUY5_9GAMM|nr:hypothetical protein [Thalassotalea piscium]MBB6544693.1 hypothetical protein [Thalassotalea piscium]